MSSREEPKNPLLVRAIDAFAKEAFGRTRTEAIAECICVLCGQPATQFRDKESAHEYEISGICQECQDELFK